MGCSCRYQGKQDVSLLFNSSIFGEGLVLFVCLFCVYLFCHSSYSTIWDPMLPVPVLRCAVWHSLGCCGGLSGPHGILPQHWALAPRGHKTKNIFFWSLQYVLNQLVMSVNCSPKKNGIKPSFQNVTIHYNLSQRALFHVPDINWLVSYGLFILPIHDEWI